MTDRAAVLKQFEKDGRVWLRDALSEEELRSFGRLSPLHGRPGARISNGHPLFQAIASARFTEPLKSLWPAMHPVRIVSFHKSPSANWGVPWHQDRIIVVRTRTETPGYSNWSHKSGSWHCEPPADLLENMLFVRVHLDRSTEENGAMEIALGSHRAGKVPAECAEALAATYETELTIAEPGDVLVLAMLTLHRSRPSKSEGCRRAVRVDYASSKLPPPLEWA